MIPSVLFIPLCPSSTWQHNELRLALRSWQKFSNIEKVLIIGHKPEWLTNVHHIPFQDKYNKVENIFRKIKLAGEYYPEFIYANDDHFLLQQLIELPYYKMGTLKKFKGIVGDTFYRYVDITARLFPNGYYFDVHTPMIVKKEILDQLEFKRDVIFKSYYCNTAGIEGEEIKDCKIHGHIRYNEISAYINGKPFLSIGEAVSIDLKKYLFEMFPEKSRFEAD